MKIERIYKGENYYSVQKLRNAIFKDSGRIFGEEPKEGREEFWAALGVTYIETPDPVKPDPTPEELAAQELERKKMKYFMLNADTGNYCNAGLFWFVGVAARGEGEGSASALL